MANAKTSSRASIGLGGITFLVLLVLKLGFHANVPWFWVFFPLWFGAAVVLGIFAIVFVVALLLGLAAILKD